MGSSTYYQSLDPVNVPAKPSTAMAVNDLLIWVPGSLGSTAGYVEHLTSISTGASEAADQATVAASFAGVSDSQALASDTAPTVRYDSMKIMEFPCVSSTFQYGDMVGATWDGGAALVNQKVKRVTNSALAIGIVLADYTAATTVVKVLFVGALPFGFQKFYYSLFNKTVLNLGAPPTDTYASTMTIDATKSYHSIQCVHATSATSTLTPSAAGSAGDVQVLEFLGDASSGTCVITFASTYRSAGTLSVTATTAWQIAFVSDGTKWVELCRTAAIT